MSTNFEKAAFSIKHPNWAWLVKGDQGAQVFEASMAKALATWIASQGPEVAKRFVAAALSRSPSSSPSLSISASPSGSLDVSSSQESVFCHRCGQRHDLGEKRCKNCGLFLHDHTKAAGAPTGAAPYTGSAPTGGFSSSGFKVGDFVTAAASGKTGRLLMIRQPNTAILLLPDMTTISIPLDQFEASGAVVAQDVPGGRHGGYEGSPSSKAALYASQSGMHALARATIRKAASPFDRFMKVVKQDEDQYCANCGHKLTERDIDDGECPECRADLDRSDAITDEPQKAAGGRLRKRWSGAEFQPGVKVVHKRTRVRGVVKQNGHDAILVAYPDPDSGNSEAHWRVEKPWELQLA